MWREKIISTKRNVKKNTLNYLNNAAEPISPVWSPSLEIFIFIDCKSLAKIKFLMYWINLSLKFSFFTTTPPPNTTILGSTELIKLAIKEPSDSAILLINIFFLGDLLYFFKNLIIDLPE